ncbi:fumarate hydratase [Escherichia coli]
MEAQHLGLGAQFGGKYFAHDIRVIRLPRHGASCPVGMGVSCSADRNIKAKINRHGIWIEKLESNPGQYIPEPLRQQGEGKVSASILITDERDSGPAFRPSGLDASDPQRHHYCGPRYRPREAERAYR